jgi:hypothetical protein
MAAFEAGGQVVCRPRTPAARRLASDPCDFRRFRCGDPVGVFLGCSWTGGVVQRVAADGALVRTRPLGSHYRRAIRVHDARNLVSQRDLRALKPDCDSQGVLL